MDVMEATKFATAEDAWMWTMRILMSRRTGAVGTQNRAGIVRPCEPDDVVRCLDALYRQRRISLLHARVLRVWGERQIAPSPKHASERAESGLWHEAMQRLEGPLRMKGIVG
jgi:hypothetical protein